MDTHTQTNTFCPPRLRVFSDSPKVMTYWRFRLSNNPVLPSQGEDNYTWDFQEPANNPETTADEGDGFETTADEGDGFEYPSV